MLELQRERELRLAAETSRDQWKKQAVDNFALYESERQRAEVYRSAGQDRKEANAETNVALTLFKEQHEDDKGFIKQLGDELRQCERAKVKWGIGGAGLGFGIGAFSRR